MKFQLSTQVLLLVACQGLALSPQATTQSGKPHSPLGRSTSDVVASSSAVQELRHNLAPTFAAAYLLATMCTSVAPCFADEYGVEKEAPTLYTGETVEICTKRGPLGACLKTEFRTEDNDNDKAKKYFRDPAITLREKNEVLQGTAGGESNALVERLKQQTEDNKEKNRMDVERRTFENDQSATFGPFDRQVIILNTDGKTYTLLQNPQAMRLKKAGFIQDRKFIKQPTEDDLQAALEAEGDGLAGAVQSLFGGGN